MSVMSLLSKASKLTLCAATFALIGTASSSATEHRYFKNVEGKWAGAGRIVAGPYKNTRFTCKLDGKTPKKAGMILAGKCRVGLFTQSIEATVSKSGSSYRGAFLDGAKGKGLDITSGKLRGQKLVLDIKRKQLRGTMVANLKNPNNLNITISVRVNGSLTPFIGLTLNRSGNVQKTTLLSKD